MVLTSSSTAWAPACWAAAVAREGSGAKYDMVE